MPVLCVVAVLLVLQLVGEVFVRMTGLPIPGALIGLLALFGGLVWLGRLPAALRDTARHVLQHLMLLFIPAVAGIMLHFERLAHEWLPFLLACVAGTVITIAVTALTLSWMMKRQQGEKS
ncbi:CidA/LrgA family protein [Neopusillimonas aromaticivorans]|uniref:CidA/LrgA family protein n=1 Tax=Neopusillimonas aromaticivorans TaxID=2979868 RepID=UPI0025963B60|nr:CidA/LrgA family protein [Neopusillimonas aromaticivorans]WJJ93719.1 CidA/LrgA family protein [Neopusillimonas aromaticivorans]